MIYAPLDAHVESPSMLDGHRDLEPVELVMRSYEAFNRGDHDEVVAIAHPEIQVQPLRSQSTTIVSGREQLRSMLERNMTAGRTHRYELRDVHELDDGGVVVVGALVEDGASLDVVAVHRVKDGHIVSACQYFSDKRTLEELNLLDGRPRRGLAARRRR